MATVSTNIKIDQQVKKEAQELFESCGLSLSAAVNMFLIKAIDEQAIPFKIERPRGRWDTLAAIEEVRRMKEDPELGCTFTDVDEMMEELLGDEI